MHLGRRETSCLVKIALASPRREVGSGETATNLKRNEEREMSVVREGGESEKKKRVSQRQYKRAIKSRRPTIRTDLAHRLQFHLILSRSPFLFFARCPSFSLLPSLRHRRMCSLGQFCLPCASGLRIDRQLQCESFEISTLREATAESVGKSTSIGVRCSRKFGKKAQLLFTTSRVFAKRIYIRIGKNDGGKRLTDLDKSNEKCEVKQKKLTDLVNAAE